MRYLFVANQEPLQGYTEFCNNTYLALFCETRRNGYNGFPNEYEKKEQLCLIGDVQKPSSQSEEVSFSQDYTSLGEEVSFKSNTSEIIDRGEEVCFNTKNVIDMSEMFNAATTQVRNFKLPKSFSTENLIYTKRMFYSGALNIQFYKNNKTNKQIIEILKVYGSQGKPI